MRYFICGMVFVAALWACCGEYSQIVVGEGAHPAVRSAAGLLAERLQLPAESVRGEAQPVAGKGVVVLEVVAELPGVKEDGYRVSYEDGGVRVAGLRPRALLYAVGEPEMWLGGGEVVVRNPAFAFRSAAYKSRLGVAAFVAEIGCNALLTGSGGSVTLEQGMPDVFAALEESVQSRLQRRKRDGIKYWERFAEECREADVEFYPMLYGNDFARWSGDLWEAVLKCYPDTRGVSPTQSWERATLCPSSPDTWKVVEAYVAEYGALTPGAGLYTTFWDHYGMYCQCERCRKSGMNSFPQQLEACVNHYRAALKTVGKQLVVRTWSSGVPHWLRDEWVHAPGYDDFGGAATTLWARVISGTDPAVRIQTKVYHADCQPEARLSELLGKVGQGREIAEWQITGQTTGRFYLPASTVDHTVRTMRWAREQVGSLGGVSIYLGGTQQRGYDVLADIANSINIRAWRQLSWDPECDIERVWQQWAVERFGAEAAPFMVRALKLSEWVVNAIFSPLGLGSDTNSSFAKNIERREILLKYTNRYYLPEGQAALAPTRENIARVEREKAECLERIAVMFSELEAAKAHLKLEHYSELKRRFEWLQVMAVCTRELDVSLWRFRYLRYLAQMMTTEPEQMRYLAASYDVIQTQRRKLFVFEPEEQFSGYDKVWSELPRPSLGSPVALMRELYSESRRYVESAVGPHGVPEEWRR